MQDFAHKKIILGITGGIAAYKSAFLARELTRLGAQVRVVMTTAAQEFITPMTFQALTGNEVHTSLLDAEAERAMGHIELARWADYLLIAPATANCLAKMAHGLADDLLSALYLVAKVPVIVCPAMNQSMWLHPATQENRALLAKRGVIFIGPASGIQACGEVGPGRLSEVDTIIDGLRTLSVYNLLQGESVLITAGPTQEALDPVRYISNRSSGKMGYALAYAAKMAGAKVTLISGPTAIAPPEGIEFDIVDSAKAMHDKVFERLKPHMIYIGAAAVSDYQMTQPLQEKFKKTQTEFLQLELTKTPDILAEVAASGKARYVIGFAAETTNVIQYAKDKLNRKKVDMIIANQVGQQLGFDQAENEVTILTQSSQLALPLMHKTRLAAEMIAILATNLQNSSQKHVINKEHHETSHSVENS